MPCAVGGQMVPAGLCLRARGRARWRDDCTAPHPRGIGFIRADRMGRAGVARRNDPRVAPCPPQNHPARTNAVSSQGAGNPPGSFQPAGILFLQDLAAFLHRRYGVAVKAADWPAGALPAHLRPRIEILDHERKPLAVGRDLAGLRHLLTQTKVEPAAKPGSAGWTRAAQQWERFGLTDWTCGDLPERITVNESQGTDGPCVARNRVCRRQRQCVSVLRSRPGAIRFARRSPASRGTCDPKRPRLARKRFASLKPFRCVLCAIGRQRRVAGNFAGTSETAHHFRQSALPALTRAHFVTPAVAEARHRLPGLATRNSWTGWGRFCNCGGRPGNASASFRLPCRPVPASFPRSASSDHPAPARAASPLSGELAGLVSSRFLERVDFEPFARICSVISRPCSFAASAEP